MASIATGSPETAFTETLIKAWPWGLNSPWSVDLAWAVVGLYLAVNAAFLQSYLGDAARYFRNSPANVAVRRAIRTEAVNTLERLHASGQYDRIVVVAHSLGSVVAYDMLRAYFSRVCNELPPVAELGPDFDDIDGAPWQPEIKLASIEEKKALRIKARNTIAHIAEATVGKPVEERKHKTLAGHGLRHGGKRADPRLVPHVSGQDPRMSSRRILHVASKNGSSRPVRRSASITTVCWPSTIRRLKTRKIHNGALFGLTRWTNIYFPRRQIFWGDAIGGGLSPIFGYHIVDIEVSTRTAGGDDFFTHTAYWDVDREPDTFHAPHIVALRNAIDLGDTGAAIDLVDKGVDPEKHEAE